MFIFRGNSRTLRVSAVLLTGSKTGFVCKFSYGVVVRWCFYGDVFVVVVWCSHRVLTHRVLP